MTSAVARLRRVSRRLSASGDADDAWAAAAIEATLADPTGATRLERLLGLAPGPGGEPWQSTEARERRDDALRELAAILAPGPSIAAKVRAVQHAAKIYRAGSWRFDRELPEMPEAYGGTAKEHLYRAFRHGGGDVPTGKTTLFEIIPPKPAVLSGTQSTDDTSTESKGLENGCTAESRIFY